jgi:site-specific DNA-cytosine methylase
MAGGLQSLHLFCGVGGDMIGFEAAGFKVCGLDNDAWAVDQARRLVRGKVHVADIEAMTVAELVALVPRCPDVVVMSAPCQGNSFNLPPAKAEEAKYQALNALATRAVLLIDGAARVWGRPPAAVFFENVPGIVHRSGHILEQCKAIWTAAGYVFHAGRHCCGKKGGLAQRRERYFILARHPDHCGPVAQPPDRALLGIAAVLGRLPVPGFGGGPLHGVPPMSDANAVRLALLDEGQDWAFLPPAVAFGDDDGAEGEEPPVAGPRGRTRRHNGGLGVEASGEPAHAVIAAGRTGNTWAACADPRIEAGPKTHPGKYGLERGAEPAHTVGAKSGVTYGRCAVADPRVGERRNGALGITAAGEATRTIRARVQGPNQEVACADPRVDGSPSPLGPWPAPPEGQSFVATHRVSYRDGLPYVLRLPGSRALDWARMAPHREPPVILSARGCYNRGFTLLELAALQGFPVVALDGGWLRFDGGTVEQVRKGIGNAIPPKTAAAVAVTIARSLRSPAFRPTVEGSALWAGPRGLYFGAEAPQH